MAASSLAKHLAKPNALLGVGGVYPIEWRSKFDDIEASGAKHLNVLEIDNAKLKKLLGKILRPCVCRRTVNCCRLAIWPSQTCREEGP